MPGPSNCCITFFLTWTMGPSGEGKHYLQPLCTSMGLEALLNCDWQPRRRAAERESQKNPKLPGSQGVVFFFFFLPCYKYTCILYYACKLQSVATLNYHFSFHFFVVSLHGRPTCWLAWDALSKEKF